MPLFAQTTETTANPALGVMIFVLGGLAGAIFYLPFKKVTNWAWESYWMVYAVIGLGHRALGSGLLNVAERDFGAESFAGSTSRLLFPLRGDVGPGRADLGTHDPLSGRRPGIGHRLRTCVPLPVQLSPRSLQWVTFH